MAAHHSIVSTVQLYDFTYEYVLPGSDVHGETITVRSAASELEAYRQARERVDYVSKRIVLRLIDMRECGRGTR